LQPMREQGGSVFAENEYRILQTVRVGMACSLGRPAEKEESEVTREEKIYYDHVMDAIERLYVWTKEQQDKAWNSYTNSEDSAKKIVLAGELAVQGKVLLQMRTLFSGLIDFEE